MSIVAAKNTAASLQKGIEKGMQTFHYRKINKAQKKKAEMKDNT